MGRGRSKAKQTKVARDLKYSNQDMDLERLAKELHGEVKEDKNFDDDPSKDNYTPRN
jgi:Fe-S-cluster formation regulator IscX/YfhJ